jgi:hypothetical protein
MQASYIRRRLVGSDEWADSIYLIVRDWEVRMVRPQFIMLLNIIDNQLADIHDISKLIVRLLDARANTPTACVFVLFLT